MEKIASMLMESPPTLRQLREGALLSSSKTKENASKDDKFDAEDKVAAGKSKGNTIIESLTDKRAKIREARRKREAKK